MHRHRRQDHHSDRALQNLNRGKGRYDAAQSCAGSSGLEAAQVIRGGAGCMARPPSPQSRTRQTQDFLLYTFYAAHHLTRRVLWCFARILKKKKKH